MRRIVIDPRLKYNYASWYLLGIQRLLKGWTIEYNVQPFIEIKYENAVCYNSGFAFIIQKNNQNNKIFIDTEDVAKIFIDRYEWCDVYGMVNPTAEQVIKYDKLIAPGPEFGVTLGSSLFTVIRCFNRFLKGNKHSNIPFKNYLFDYLYTNIRRRPIEAYERTTEIRSNYIFHASTLWYNKFATTDTNVYRGEFLMACKKAGLNIEGGLYYVNDKSVLKENPDYPKYKEEYRDFICKDRISIDDYIRKTKDSVVVFNTPSVCECHGGQLAEYLCLGKAIISTPLTREMPSPLLHSKQVHFVDSANEIYDAVIKINSDEHYRKQLERGARKYYEEWIAPEVVIKRLLEKIREKV